MRNVTWAWIMAVVTASPAAAESFTLRFSAVVNLDPGGSIEFPDLGFRFFDDEVVSGRFTYDTEVTDQDPNPHSGRYQPRGVIAWTSAEAHFRSQMASASVTDFNNLNGERVSFGAGLFSEGRGSTALFFRNCCDSLLSSDALPDASVLIKFPEQTWLFGGGDEAFVTATITSLSVDSGAPVPEPTTLLLLGMGGLGAFATRRRRRKAPII